MSINILLCNFLFSDKMNSRNMILSGALIALVMLVTTNVFFASSALAIVKPGEFNPQGQIQVWEVKSDIQVCNSGSETPQGPNYEIGGCLDLQKSTDPTDTTIGNQTYVRSGSYLFTGETLSVLVVARDLQGATWLSPTAELQINSVDKVLCTQFPYNPSGTVWFGHNVGKSSTGLLSILPPQLGSIGPGFNAAYDVLYSCTYTAGMSDSGLQPVSVVISDIAGNTASTLDEMFTFNPPILASVSFDSGTSLMFPSGVQPGTTTFATNSLLITNAGSGVDLIVFLTGNDMWDNTTASSGIALCPTTNVLNISNVGYKCKVGSFTSEQYTPLPELKQSAACAWSGVLWGKTADQITCLVPDGTPGWPYSNLLIPDPGALITDSILHSGVTAQCYFDLNVPRPCFGTYSAPNAVDVLIRAI